MSQSDQFDLEIEPEEPPGDGFAEAMLSSEEPNEPLRTIAKHGSVTGVIADAQTAEAVALAQVLPENFPLFRLLSFLPDIRLKHRAEALATQADDVDVTAEDGLQRADTVMADLRTALADIERGFADPTDLAYQLHKRLTGLRADFSRVAKAKLEALGREVYQETQRREREAREVRRKAQEEADRQVREQARRAAAEAERSKAPKPVVESLLEASRTATAQPVPVSSGPGLTHSAAVQRWKARPAGTPGDAEPNPKMADMTPAQHEQVRTLAGAIATGSVPVSAIQIDWPYLNRRAAAEKSALQIPGIEPFDAGNLRSKGRR